MVLTKVRANKTGGERIKYTPEEEVYIRADWAKNVQEQIAKEQAIAEKKAQKEAAFDKLTKELTKEEKQVLRDHFIEEL